MRGEHGKLREDGREAVTKVRAVDRFRGRGNVLKFDFAPLAGFGLLLCLAARVPFGAKERYWDLELLACGFSCRAIIGGAALTASVELGFALGLRGQGRE